MPTITRQTMGWFRTSVGVALIVAPAAPLRLAGDRTPTGASILLMRTIGIRDLVLGLGTVSAAWSGTAGDPGRWTAAALASDSLDTIVSLAAIRAIGKRDSLIAAAMAFSFALGDLRAIRASSD